jgi:hypothetical protein
MNRYIVIFKAENGTEVSLVRTNLDRQNADHRAEIIRRTFTRDLSEEDREWIDVVSLDDYDAFECIDE